MSARAWFVAAALLFALMAQAQTPPASPASPPATQPPAAGTAEEKVQPTLGDDKDVIRASEQWLKLIDTGKLGPAWDVGAPFLKKSVTRNEWIQGIGAARKPFGKVASRKAEKFARAHELPGAPEGDYALVMFDTRFANGKTAQEHLTWFYDDDGVWRISGYFIR